MIAPHAWVGTDVVEVLRRATAGDPGERFPSAEELLRALKVIPQSRWNPASEPEKSLRTDSRDIAAILGSDFQDRLSPSFREAYELHEVVGQGAIGVVCRGTDRRSGRPVAVKFMQAPSGAQRDDQFRRFAREADILARLSHPNLVTVYGMELDAEMAHIVFELVEGEPLSDRIAREAPMDPAVVLDLARDILAGLEALHSENIIHRDIKPANLIVTATGVKIIDLGIARVQDTVDDLTRTGDLVGTPAYTAPEQLQSPSVDHTADYYSLGLVMFNALTGRLPFEGSMMEVLAQKVRSDPPPVESLAPVPEPLATAVNRLLVRNPRERPQTAREVRRLLSRRPTESLRIPTDASSSSGRPGSSLRVGAPAAGHVSWFLVLVLFVLGGVLGGTAGSLGLDAVRLSAPEVVARGNSITVSFRREPPGPAELRIRSSTRPDLVLSLAAVRPDHAIHLTDIAPGERLELEPIAGSATGPVVVYTMPVPPVPAGSGPATSTP